MQILLDTNFILTCAKQKIDFESITKELVDESIEWLVPQDVLNELGNIKDRTGERVQDKRAAETSFKILQSLKPKIINLPSKNPNVDIKIISYVLGTEIVLATLDKNLKSKIDNQILTIRGKKNLEII